MKTINNRKSELLKRFMTVQQCVGDDIDPTKHKVMTEQAILNIDAATMGEVKKEVKKLLDCSEGAAFTAQELEQMLLETAAMCIQQGKTARDNAAAATTAFLAQITHRTRRYLVPFALLGLRLGHLPPDMSSLRIGVCELCADIKCLKDIFAAIEVR